jgi:hypothetical protein
LDGHYGDYRRVAQRAAAEYSFFQFSSEVNIKLLKKIAEEATPKLDTLLLLEETYCAPILIVLEPAS